MRKEMRERRRAAGATMIYMVKERGVIERVGDG
jgi:hypothetical protein